MQSARSGSCKLKPACSKVKPASPRAGQTHRRRLGGSAARRLGGSAARRLGGSAARRLGGSAARRLGGSAARRLGGSAAIIRSASALFVKLSFGSEQSLPHRTPMPGNAVYAIAIGQVVAHPALVALNKSIISPVSPEKTIYTQTCMTRCRCVVYAKPDGSARRNACSSTIYSATLWHGSEGIRRRFTGGTHKPNRHIAM